MKCVEEPITGEYKYKGVRVDVRLDKARLVNGKVVNREVVEHPGGVGILPLDSEGNCYMVRQFRYPVMKEMLEIPAGKLEKGEEHLRCAVRELSEETGFESDDLIYLGKFCTSPGFSTEILHVYLAMGLRAGNMHPDEDEFLNVEKYSLKELLRMCMDGEIEDAKTIVAVLKTSEYLKENNIR